MNPKLGADLLPNLVVYPIRLALFVAGRLSVATVSDWLHSLFSAVKTYCSCQSYMIGPSCVVLVVDLGFRLTASVSSAI